MTDFGKQVKIALIEKGWTQNRLIEEVKAQSGLYVDRSYMSKTLNGLYVNPKIVEAIKEVLGIGA